jgi:hypothetical protein
MCRDFQLVQDPEDNLEVGVCLLRGDIAIDDVTERQKEPDRNGRAISVLEILCVSDSTVTRMH